jgi:hypothetical protein
MTRKLLLIPALLIGAGLFFATAPANADPYNYHHHHGYHGPIVVRPIVSYPVYRPVFAPSVVITAPVVTPQFQVVFRAICNEPWRTYQVFGTRIVAGSVANDLRGMGYETAVFPY